jgi:3-hydroxymyristoyl/3-hydroxydecanoyl-(acyl carrier protein) dehydratase
MPAVLVLEAMAQTCGAMMMSYPEWKNKIAYFMAVEKAKFRKPVLPADTLEIALEILRFGTVGRCRACAYVKSEIAAQAQMSFILSGK